MSNEFHRKFRPATLDAMIGQTDAVKMIRQWLRDGEVPHAVAFTGPSGCGKTTLARILKKELGCRDHDFGEINAADFRGIDTIRDIRRRMGLAPAGKSRIYLIDEAHKLSGDAQNSFLKILEEPPPHVYFFLATTESNKLLKTIQTRCTEIRLRSLSIKDLQKLITTVAKSAGVKIPEDVVDLIAERTDGSARKALVMLGSIAKIPDEETQRNLILKADLKNEAIHIARALMDGRTRWPDMAKILKDTDLDEAEGIRHMVLAYCTTILLSGKTAARAAMIIDYFREPFYTKSALVASCFDIVAAK